MSGRGSGPPDADLETGVSSMGRVGGVHDARGGSRAPEAGRGSPRSTGPATLVVALAVLAVLVSGSYLLAADATPVLPTPAPTPGPVAPTPTPSPSPVITLEPVITPLPSPDLTPVPSPFVAARPTRVAVPSLHIDLPVVVPPKNERWPLCDVAEYLSDFDWPGEGGTTYIYAHAQKGMFLPILVASWRKNGRALIGDEVHVWTDDDRHYVYKIVQVRRHRRSLGWASRLPPESLVLQTSENQYASGPKVMVVASFRGVAGTSHRAAHPKARPRRCG